MKTIFAILAAFVSLSLGSLAIADASGPAWACHLQSTKLRGYTAALGLSVTSLRGRGVVHCSSLMGRNQIDTPVSVRLYGIGGGLGYARVSGLDVGIASVGVSSPNDLFGTFRLQGAASVTFLENGGSLHSFFAVNDAGLSVGVGVAGYRGYGMDINGELQSLVIRPLR